MIGKESLLALSQSDSSSGGGGPTPILDAFGQPYSAWSHVKLHSAFSGTTRIRETSGGTETEISYGADLLLDASAIDTHLGGGAGTVVDVDNQGTFGGSMSQSSTGIQPNIIDSAIYTGQKVFDSVADNMVQDFGSNVLDLNTFDHFAVFIPKAASGYKGIYGLAPTTTAFAQSYLLHSISGITQYRGYLAGGLNFNNVSPNFNNEVCIFHFYRNGGGSDTQVWFYYNGNTYTGTTALGSTLSNVRYVMWSGERISALTSAFTGELSALIMYQGTSLSSGDRTALRTALQTQFS